MASEDVDAEVLREWTDQIQTLQQKTMLAISKTRDSISEPVIARAGCLQKRTLSEQQNVPDLFRRVYKKVSIIINQFLSVLFDLLYLLILHLFIIDFNDVKRKKRDKR